MEDKKVLMGKIMVSFRSVNVNIQKLQTVFYYQRCSSIFKTITYRILFMSNLTLCNFEIFASAEFPDYPHNLHIFAIIILL